MKTHSHNPYFTHRSVLSLFTSSNQLKIMEQRRIFEGKNGAKYFVHEDHLYKLKCNRKLSKYFLCNFQNCKTSILVSESNDVIRKRGDHLHEPESVKVSAVMCIAQMKNRAISEPNVPLLQIYRQELAKQTYGPDVCELLPNFKGISSTLQRLRSSVLPRIPKTIDDITLPDQWSKTVDGKNFIIADDGIGNDRIIIFGTRENLNILSRARKIAMDGTFKIQPIQFTQLYTIHGKYMNKFFPLVFALLPSKTQYHYERMLRLIKEAEGSETSLNFEMCLCDFETAAINTMHTVFPDVVVKGCYFHFTQAIIRKVQALGLKRNYENDGQYRKWIRRVASLPLVPPELIEDAFLLIHEDAPQHAKTFDFHEYIVDTYLKEDYFFREQSLFPIALWNHFENSEERTTNNVEGWHSKLNRRAHGHHLNIYNFALLLKQEQSENEAIMRMMDAGHHFETGKKKYRLLDARLSSLKQKIINREISLLSYMDSVSNLIHLE